MSANKDDNDLVVAQLINEMNNIKEVSTIFQDSNFNFLQIDSNAIWHASDWRPVQIKAPRYPRDD